MKELALFCGHSGKDCGAISPVDRSRGDEIYGVESEITANVGHKVALFMRILGMSYRLVHGGWERRLNDSHGCDAGISLHADSLHDRSVHGFHVIYYPGSAEGERLAREIDSALGMLCQRARSPHAMDLYILRHTGFPCVLVEMGFLSNVVDEGLLISDEYQCNLAFQLVQGFRQWMFA